MDDDLLRLEVPIGILVVMGRDVGPLRTDLIDILTGESDLVEDMKNEFIPALVRTLKFHQC